MAGWLYRLHRRHLATEGPAMDMAGGFDVKRVVAWIAIAALVAGMGGRLV